MSKVPVLFDANGSFGKRSTGEPDFPALADRLAHMDRFGVARSLVWNIESLQGHAGCSNRHLLEAIENTPGAAGRLIPSLTVSGLLHYEAGGVKTLVDQMRRARTRALRFVNVYGRLTLRQLEPLMPALRRIKPFIVLRHDQATPADILEFTARFPWITLVLTEVMWGPCVIVFDLMRQRPNILLDNSWLHSCGAIELAVKRFGAERLVFGMGSRSHNGAAIAALARARISERERRLIACGNLERLTGLPPGRPVEAAVPRGNTLWPRFLSGAPLTVDVVDAHGHLGPSAGYVLEDQEDEPQLERARADLESTGVRTMIFSGLQALHGGPVEGNDSLEALLASHPDRFLGYVAFNPHYAKELTPRLDRWFKGSVFVGFKTLCDYWQVPITDPRFKPMWQYASRHRLPVLSHTWSSTYDGPAMFADLAAAYPRVPFLLGHSGGSDAGRREAEELARRRPNVYLEWCGSFCSTMPWEKTLEGLPAGRVVYGTDGMVHDINWELGRLLSLNVSDAVLKPILAGTMRKLLSRRC